VDLLGGGSLVGELSAHCRAQKRDRRANNVSADAALQNYECGAGSLTCRIKIRFAEERGVSNVQDY
jgi:hypothetical protein